MLSDGIGDGDDEGHGSSSNREAKTETRKGCVTLSKTEVTINHEDPRVHRAACDEIR